MDTVAKLKQLASMRPRFFNRGEAGFHAVTFPWYQLQ